MGNGYGGFLGEKGWKCLELARGMVVPFRQPTKDHCNVYFK